MCSKFSMDCMPPLMPPTSLETRQRGSHRSMGRPPVWPSWRRLSLSARTTGAPPGRRGCLWTSRMKTGMPREGSWSCLSLPQI
ncbi:unnamed protein product, partial [Gulo gulo]